MKKMIIPIAVLIFLAWGCKKDQLIEPIDFDRIVPEEVPEEQAEVLFEFYDIDNNLYHAIKIGERIWSQENLKTTRYNDGTPIPCIQGTSEWTALKSGAYCHYKNNPVNSEKYGLLYNYFAVESNKLAPEGWHVATVEDWETIIKQIDDGVYSCLNSTGFTVLPNGYRDIALSLKLSPEHEFDCQGSQACWWTSDHILIYYDDLFGIFTGDDKPSDIGSGIRLVKDADDTVNDDPDDQGQVSDLSEFKDIEGNIYHAIQIGDQIWSRENLKTTRYNDGTPIPCIQGTTEWATSKSGAFCHYNNVASNSVRYGLLYNYYAIASKKLAPKGWHVASYTDWVLLLAEVGLNNENLDGDVGPLVDAKDWKGPFYATTRDFESRKITCTNSTGFTALPNGYRDIALSLNYDPEREFDCLGYQASWWTSDRIMVYLDGTFGVFPRNDIPSEVGSGVRLVKDAN